jgi:hypothetical protein
MTDRLLTPDALRAIAARAEALDALNGTLSRVKQLRDPDWRLGVISGHVAYPLDDDQAETAWRFVEHAQDDVPRLLAHIRAQDEANARLEAALRDVCAAAEYVDPYEEGMDQCLLCNCWREDGHFKHDDDCPVGAARALLDGGLDTLGPARVRMNMRAAGPLPPSEPREWDWLDDDTDGSKGGSGDDAP